MSRAEGEAARPDDAASAPIIGLLNQRSLHAAIREWYARPGDLFEQKVDGFVVDIVRGDLLVEIQTANIAAIGRKLAALAAAHKVLLVFPIAAQKHIVRVTKAPHEELSRRLSPKRGTLHDLFSEFVRAAYLPKQKGFGLEVLLTYEEEIRCDDGKGSWRRKGVSITDRRLVEVVGSVPFPSRWDFLRFIPEGLEQPFTNRMLAEAAGVRLALAQRMTYSLKKMGVIAETGKRGNWLLFKRRRKPGPARCAAAPLPVSCAAPPARPLRRRKESA